MCFKYLRLAIICHGVERIEEDKLGYTWGGGGVAPLRSKSSNLKQVVGDRYVSFLSQVAESGMKPKSVE